MNKAVIASAFTAFGVLGWQAVDPPRPTLLLKEEAMTIKYNPSIDEAVLVVEAESEEALGRIEVRGTTGQPMFRLSAQTGADLSLSGFVFETRESSALRLFERYREGIYDIHARTVDGRNAIGSAVLSHALLSEPRVLQPAPGAQGVPTDLLVSWVPDPQAAGYEVFLEQNESDGVAVKLPRDAHEFRVPFGVLYSRTETQLEVGVVGFNGNRTLVEIEFTTR